MLKRRLGLIAAGAIFFIAGAAPAFAEVAVPPLAARVTDLTSTLSAQEIQALEGRLRDFESRKGSQIAVLILPSTQPETIEQYSIRVAEAWKIGRARIDDGAIIVVAKDDRRLRVEVGRGLEGAIPDAIAKRVVSDVITPRFKANDFYGGISAGTDALIKLIEGEPLPAPQAQRGSERVGGDSIEPFVVLLVAFVVLGGLLTRVLGRVLGATATAGMVGVAAWVVAGIAVAVFATIFAFILTLIVGASGFSQGRRGRGGWSSGGWAGGGGWSGGDSGGFSGGGGDFGGGGASGSW
jgi:uncharacterized protein